MATWWPRERSHDVGPTPADAVTEPFAGGRLGAPARALRRDRVVRYVLLYTSADDLLAKAPAHLPAHKARLDAFHADGTLLMVGTFGDPRAEDSMAIFTTREAAEEFVAGDPFVLNGVVQRWELRAWDEILAGS